MMKKRFALITGAGQGMGRTIALELAREGVHIILAGRTESKLTETLAEIKGQHGEGTVISVDITDPQSVNAAQQAVQDLTPYLDMLINCAGEALIRKIEETTEEDWARILDENLSGHFRMIRAFLPMLRRSENASIINIVSKVALQGYGSGVSAYTAAKSGMLGFTRALAAELAEEEIRAVALCPGPVDTPMRWSATPDFDRRRVIDDYSIARTVSYLISLPRGVTTGEILIESVHNR